MNGPRAADDTRARRGRTTHASTGAPTTRSILRRSSDGYHPRSSAEDQLRPDQSETHQPGDIRSRPNPEKQPGVLWPMPADLVTSGGTNPHLSSDRARPRFRARETARGVDQGAKPATRGSLRGGMGTWVSVGEPRVNVSHRTLYHEPPRRLVRRKSAEIRSSRRTADGVRSTWRAHAAPERWDGTRSASTRSKSHRDSTPQNGFVISDLMAFR